MTKKEIYTVNPIKADQKTLLLEKASRLNSTRQEMLLNFYNRGVFVSELIGLLEEAKRSVNQLNNTSENDKTTIAELYKKFAGKNAEHPPIYFSEEKKEFSTSETEEEALLRGVTTNKTYYLDIKDKTFEIRMSAEKFAHYTYSTGKKGHEYSCLVKRNNDLIEAYRIIQPKSFEKVFTSKEKALKTLQEFYPQKTAELRTLFLNTTYQL